MSREDITLRKRLDELLFDLFTQDQLYRFLVYFSPGGSTEGRDLAADLPAHDTTSKSEYVFKVVEGLLCRGLVTDDLYAALREARPYQFRRIDEVSNHTFHRTTTDIDAPQRNPFTPFSCFEGRSVEINSIRHHARNGQSALLIGGRRSGKTALLDHIDDCGRKILRLDAAALPLSEGEGAVLQEIARLTGTKAASREGVATAIEAMMPVALTMDEADRLLSYAWSASFLAWLRYLDDTRLRTGLAFVLVGGPSLAHYRNPDDRGSPVLNTSEPVWLKPLDRPARERITHRLGRKVDLEALFLHVGGHPWLLTRVLRYMWEGQTLENALDAVYESGRPHFETWVQQLGRDGRLALRAVPPDGIKGREFARGGALSRLGKGMQICMGMGLVDTIDDWIHPGPRLFLDWLASEVDES